MSVSDTGPGISDEMKTEIFQPFEQADTSINRKFEGTGLGLSICQQLAQLMGGEISVDDNPAGGSRFSLRIKRVLRQTNRILVRQC